MTKPASANDPVAKKALQVELKQKFKLGKRKSREFQESESEEVGVERFRNLPVSHIKS